MLIALYTSGCGYGMNLNRQQTSKQKLLEPACCVNELNTILRYYGHDEDLIYYFQWSTFLIEFN